MLRFVPKRRVGAREKGLWSAKPKKPGLAMVNDKALEVVDASVERAPSLSVEAKMVPGRHRRSAAAGGAIEDEGRKRVREEPNAALDVECDGVVDGHAVTAAGSMEVYEVDGSQVPAGPEHRLRPLETARG